jgi:ubiquinone/menaquinone biosynthesis C-methylase UbiE
MTLRLARELLPARRLMRAHRFRTQEEHFDAVAGAYDETIPEHIMSRLTRRRVSLATELTPHGGRVLDVGCGTGRFLLELPGDRYERIGVDVSSAMLDVPRRGGIEVHHASGGELPFSSGSFDLVTTFAVLHHLIDPELVRATLREMARVVRPGGAIIVWDSNPLNPYWRVLMRRLPQDQGDEKLVSARRILQALQSTGLVDIRLRRLTFTPDFTPVLAMPFVALLERALERVPGVRTFAAHNVVTARSASRGPGSPAFGDPDHRDVGGTRPIPPSAASMS